MFRQMAECALVDFRTKSRSEIAKDIGAPEDAVTLYERNGYGAKFGFGVELNGKRKAFMLYRDASEKDYREVCDKLREFASE